MKSDANWPSDLIAYKWAETLSEGENAVLLTSSLKRLQEAIAAAIADKDAEIERLTHQVWELQPINQPDTDIDKAVAEERERCARVAEQFKGGYTASIDGSGLIADPDGPWCLGTDVAAAIRKGEGKA